MDGDESFTDSPLGAPSRASGGPGPGRGRHAAAPSSTARRGGSAPGADQLAQLREDHPLWRIWQHGQTLFASAPWLTGPPLNARSAAFLAEQLVARTPAP